MEDYLSRLETCDMALEAEARRNQIFTVPEWRVKSSLSPVESNVVSRLDWYILYTSSSPVYGRVMDTCVWRFGTLD